MKWAFFSITLAVVAVLAVPALFAWVGWLAFGEARVSGVSVIPAMIFVGLCLGAWTAFTSALDALSDWVAQRGAVNIAKTQGEMAGGIKELSNLQRSQAGALAATLRAMNAAQGNSGPMSVPGGLDWTEGD